MPSTVTQIAESHGVTRQSIVLQIKNGRIKSEKKYGRWYIEEKDYLEFRRNRYVRYLDGEELYNKKKGFYSPREAAEFLGCGIQRIYNHLRQKHLKSARYKSAWIIHINDIMKYKETLIENPKMTRKNRYPYRRIVKK